MSVDLNTVKVEWAYPEHDLQLNDYYGLGGGAGWWFPNGGTSYKRSENTIAGLEFTDDNGATGTYMVFDTTGASGPVYSSWFSAANNSPFSTQADLYIGRTSSSPSPVTVEVELADANGTVLTKTAGTALNVTATGWTNILPYGTATGAVKARLKITGIGVYGVRDVNIADAQFDTNYYSYGEFGTYSGGSFLKPTAAMRKQWTDVTSKVYAINIKRGCRPNPPVDQLEIGTAVIGIKGTISSTATYGGLRQGARIRVSAKVGTEWQPIFTGRLSKESVYDKSNGKTYTEWLVEDRVSDIARAEAPGIRGSNLTERIESILNPAPTGDVISNTSQTNIRVLGATHVMYDGNEAYAYQSNANKLDHLLTMRNTDFGLVFCDKNNILQYVSGGGGASVPDRRGVNTYTFVTGTKKTGEKSFLVAGFDDDRDNEYSLNAIETSRLSGTTGVSAEYGARHMAIRYGKRSGSVAFVSATDTSQTVASNYINEFATVGPIDSFKWNATKDVADAATVEIYDNLALWVAGKYTSGVSDNSGYPANVFGQKAVWHRVIGLEHEITPGSWIVTVSCRAKETTTKTGITVQGF